MPPVRSINHVEHRQFVTTTRFHPTTVYSSRTRTPSMDRRLRRNKFHRFITATNGHHHPTPKCSCSLRISTDQSRFHYKSQTGKIDMFDNGWDSQLIKQLVLQLLRRWPLPKTGQRLLDRRPLWWLHPQNHGHAFTEVQSRSANATSQQQRSTSSA